MSQRTPKNSYWQDAPTPRDQLVLFTQSLESRIPEDHPVRLLDEILGSLDWTAWEAKYHGSYGQPPIHPQIMASVLLFAMIRRVRSSRQIEYQIRHSIDFMWLVSGRTIDHDTISEFRRQNSDQLKNIYRQMIRIAIDMNVAKLGELCIDGTRVLANANRYRTWTAERVKKVIAALDRQLAEALADIETSDSIEDLIGQDISADQLPPEIADLKTRREKLDEILGKLNTMDEQRKKYGKDPDKNPAQIPKTDPDSRTLLNKEGGYAANYTPMAVTETENGFIVGADVLIGNVEHDVLLPMVQEISTIFDVDVETVMGDTAYSAGENLSAAEEANLEILAPLADVKCEANPAPRDDLTQPVATDKLDELPNNPTTKKFDKSAFVYDEAADCYYCPAGKPLPRHGTEKKHRSGSRVILQTVYMCGDCRGCPLADRCRKDPNAVKGRRITHDDHEAARRRQRERMKKPEVQNRYKKRKSIAERPFAVIKAAMDLRRFLLRGIEGVQTEWLWACTAHNLKKLMATEAALRSLSDSQATLPEN